MDKYNKIIQAVHHLKKPDLEKNIFSLGGRGHYENPISDILAFFLSPKEQHGFGSLVLESLFQSANKENIAFDLVDNPIREQATSSGKRIDLIIEGNSWVLVIENKIRHEAVNPFDDYEQYIRDTYQGKEAIFVLLSTRKETAPVNWVPVTYQTFLTQIKTNIGKHLLSATNNKWHVILREFILNIESEYGSTMINQDRINFARKHYTEIQELNIILKEYMAYLGKKGKDVINQASNNEGVASASLPKSDLNGFVLNFYSDQWSNKASISLWIWGGEDFRLQFYLHNVSDTQDIAIKKHFALDAIGYKNFKPEQKTSRCIGFFDRNNEADIFAEIERLTKKLNSYFQLESLRQEEFDAIADPA